MVNLSKFSKPASDNTWQVSYVIALNGQRRTLKHATIHSPGGRPTKMNLGRPFLSIIRTRVAIRTVRLFATLHSGVEVEIEDPISIADMQTVASFEWRDENAAVVSLQYRYLLRPDVVQTVEHDIVIALEFNQQALCSLLLKMFQRPLLDGINPVWSRVLLQDAEEWTLASSDRGLAGVTHIDIVDERRGSAPHHVIVELNGTRTAVIAEVGDCFADVLAVRIVDDLNHPLLSSLPLLLDSVTVSPMDSLDKHGIRFDSVIRVTRELVPLWIFIENRFQVLYTFEAGYDWHAFNRQYCLLYEAEAPQEMIFRDTTQPGLTPKQGDGYMKYPPSAHLVPLRCAGVRRFFVTDNIERFYTEWLPSGFDANGIELLRRNRLVTDGISAVETYAFGIPVLEYIPSLTLRGIPLDTAIELQ